jgi:hypothetical protein
VNAPAPPSFWLCAGVWCARMLLMLNAWWVVGAAVLLGKIKPGPIRRGQWNGEIDGLGETGDNYPFPSAQIPRCLAWFETPDEPGPFPAYETGIIAVHSWAAKSLGDSRAWGFTVWWNWSLRNVAHGLLQRWRVNVDTDFGNAALRQQRWGIGYGWKQYRDWRAEVGAPHGYVKPKYYLVPSFFNNEK